MSFLSPTPHTRLNEAVGIILLLLSLAVWLCLLSYSSADPSWNTASGAAVTHNLLGQFGAKWADLLFQIFGLSVFLLPIHIGLLGWKWLRSSYIEGLGYRISGMSGSMVLHLNGLRIVSAAMADWRQRAAQRSSRPGAGRFADRAL